MVGCNGGIMSVRGGDALRAPRRLLHSVVLAVGVTALLVTLCCWACFHNWGVGGESTEHFWKFSVKSLIRLWMEKKSSKNFRKRFLEFSPWFYYLRNFQWSYCWNCFSGSYGLMAQGKAERMQFLCHCLYNSAGTFKTIAKIHSFPCSSTTAEDV